MREAVDRRVCPGGHGARLKCRWSHACRYTRLLGLDVELDAPVAGAILGCGVGRDRLRIAVTDRRHPLVRHTGFHQVVGDRASPSLRQPLIARGLALGIGVALDLDRRVGAGLRDHRQLVERAEADALDLGAGALEVDGTGLGRAA